MSIETIEPTNKLLDAFRKATGVKNSPAKLELAPPTAAMAARITAIFEGDGDVFTIFDYKAGVIRILVKGGEKADAVNFLIRHTHVFGNQTLKVVVVAVLENGETEELQPTTYTITLEGEFNLYQAAFLGNPYVKGYQKIHDDFFQKDYYIILTGREACRIKDDNASSPKGYTCELASELIKQVFDVKPYILPSTLCW